jgi:hypothetical protein
VDFHRAMLLGIGEKLKIEFATPTVLPPGLGDVLKRLVEQEKDKQKN